MTPDTYNGVFLYPVVNALQPYFLFPLSFSIWIAEESFINVYTP